MSRPYRIEVPEGVCEVERCSGRVGMQIDLLDILPLGEMRALLQAELEGVGFVPAGAAFVRTRSGLLVEVTAEANRLSVRASGSDEQLAAGVAALKWELVDIDIRVTMDAVKRKAARIGQIKELTQDPPAGTLTIVLET
jgi:hypothetical protein